MQATRSLADCGQILAGGTPSRSNPAYWGGDIPWISAKSLKTFDVESSEDRVTVAGARAGTTTAPAGSVLFVVRGMSLANEFRVGVTSRPVTFNQDLRALVPFEGIDERYLAHFLRASQRSVLGLVDEASHGTKRLTSDRLAAVQVPLPDPKEQRRITEVLDRAEALRAKRRAAEALLDTLTGSFFLDLFGNPATNPFGWRVRPLGDLAAKFSDGPFGSNLKTADYSASGVRVVRLQNIGIGTFLDSDRAFVSEQHFDKLSKHECLPGDVLVATLGDPNLRACLQPSWLSRAVNKADCVQIRPAAGVANASFLCALLNLPSTEAMAHDLVHGQTRLRISMGRLRELKVPVPPVDLQSEFARCVAAIDKLKASHRASLSHLNALFASLQHRAFRGEL